MSMFCLSVIHIPKTKTLRAVMLVAVALSAGSLLAEGQVFWQEGGVVVCESTWAIRQAAASDDSGGVFVVWYDTRGENGSVRAQHVDRDGNTVWQRNGVFVGDGDPHDINQLSALSDGRGGLVAVWQAGDDLTPYGRHQVTAQRLDAIGAVLWDSSGVVVAGADSGFTYGVAAVSDGSGGAIVAWTVAAWESTGVDSLVVQRIDSLGNLRWGTPGLVLETDSVSTHPAPRMCSGIGGGVCIAWNASKSYRQAIVQHIDSSGCTTWPDAGARPFASHLSPADIMPLSGGYMIAGSWSDGIRAQSIDEQGQLLWGADGSSVFSGTPGGLLGRVLLLPGSDSSSFVVWSEIRDNTTVIYSQFMNSMGVRQWDSLGVEVGSTNDHDSYLLGCVPAGDGLVASWPYNSGGPTRYDIYAQHVDRTGQLLWGDPGLGIATDSGMQYWEPCVVTDDRGGAIISWGYSYFGGHVGLSVQRVGDVTGVAGPAYTLRSLSVIQARPSPARSAVEVIQSRPSENVVISDALGRVVREVLAPPGSLRAVWDLTDSEGSRVPAGVYVFRQRESGTSLGRVVVVSP